MKVCIVIPMYNEETIARSSLETILRYVYELPAEVRVVVVEDGSKDATPGIVQEVVEAARPGSIAMVVHPRNMGYGSAIRTGIRYAADHGYDYALFMDSDLTNHPRFLRDFLPKMEEGWDYIKASRYMPGGGSETPWARRVVSRWGNRVAKVVSGIPLTDATNGFRAVKVSILCKLALKEDTFAIITEELGQARKHTRSFCEIPTVLGDRSDAARPTSFTYRPGMFWRYLKYLL